MLFIRAIPFSSIQQSGEVSHRQQGCLIPFAKIREMVCLRLGAGNALLGGGKLSEEQRLYVGCVTDSCLACSTPDTGESSVWTCCGMANGGRNGNITNIRQTQPVFLFFYLKVWIWNTLFQRHTLGKCACVHMNCKCACAFVCVLSLNPRHGSLPVLWSSAVNQASSGSPS